MAKATMPKGEVKRESRCKVSILRDASGCPLKICSIVGIDTGSKKCLAFELEVDGRRVNEDNE